MAGIIKVGLQIGAAVSGTLRTAFGSATSTIQQLGRAGDALKTKHQQLGRALTAGLASGEGGLGRLRAQYERTGRAVERVRLSQERLNTSILRGERLKTQRANLRGQALETIGTAAAVGAPLIASIKAAINFQDETRGIGITAKFNKEQEADLAQLIRRAALDGQQTHDSVMVGVGGLVEGNLDDLDALKFYVPAMTKVATATGAAMEDLAKTTVALRNSMGIRDEKEYTRAMNMLATGGKEGQFELADMAKWLPALGAQYGESGLSMTGSNAVAELAATLQVARMGAGSSDEAANNFKNFMVKLTAPDTIKSFKDVGIDLKVSLNNLAAEGLSPVKAMLRVVTQYMNAAGPKAATEYTKALKIKDDVERELALKRLNEAYKLGELFRDQQVLAFLRPALANQDKLGAIEQAAIASADTDVIGEDFKSRTETAGASLKNLGIRLTEIGITVGTIFLPALVEVTNAIVPVVREFGIWAEQNPGLIKGIVGVVVGLLAGKLAFIALAYGVNLVLSPINMLRTGINLFASKWVLLRTSILLTGRGLGFVGQGLLTLGGILGGTLLRGLRLAGTAIIWLGRALLMNPIGLAITAIAVGAYLIYRYWEPIKGFFSGLWTEIKAGFSGGLTGILGLLVNFSPAGLFYRAFAGVMNYFGIELPGKFTEFGGSLLTGLVGGITSKLAQVKESILGIGQSIKSWFSNALDINSPSRVFIGYGANIGEGAALGITGSTGLIQRATQALAATAAAVTFAAPDIAQLTGALPGTLSVNVSPIVAPAALPGSQQIVPSPSQRPAVAIQQPAILPQSPHTPSLPIPDMATVSRAAMLGNGLPGGDAGMTIQFSPTIKIAAATNSDIKQQVNDGLRLSFEEFERFMRRYQQQLQRRSYRGSV